MAFLSGFNCAACGSDNTTPQCSELYRKLRPCQRQEKATRRRASGAGRQEQQRHHQHDAGKQAPQCSDDRQRGKEGHDLPLLRLSGQPPSVPPHHVPISGVIRWPLCGDEERPDPLRPRPKARSRAYQARPTAYPAHWCRYALCASVRGVSAASLRRRRGTSWRSTER